MYREDCFDPKWQWKSGVGPDDVDQSCLQFEDVDGWSGGDSNHSQPTSLQRAERMEPFVCLMEEAAT